jgi:hypothetical protein
VLHVETIQGARKPRKLELAIEAVMWGIPLVGAGALREAAIRDAGAREGDIVYLSAPADSLFRAPTPNASALYAYFDADTRAGPLVLDMPPAVGAGLFGSILDAWQVPAVDLGPAGEDAGRGGKYLLLPPGYDGYVPVDYEPVRLRTYTAYAALRAIREDGSAAGHRRALDLVRQIRVYPLAQAKNPPPSRHIDVSGKIFDAIVRFDETFFPQLSRLLNQEPLLEIDRAFIERLREIGIERGRPYSPSSATRQLHERAARVAHERLVKHASTEGARYWMKQRWRCPSVIGCRTGFTFVVNGKLDVESRALFSFISYAPPKRCGRATFYLMTFADGDGQRLDGSSTYRLLVPPGVPASQFWAATVYDAETFAFIEESPRVALSSYDQALRKNTDGSVELYFCPAASADPNWVPTAPGKPWFTIFRFYGPKEPLFDRSWQLPDIERVHVS